MTDFSKLRFPGIEAALNNDCRLQLNTAGHGNLMRIGFLDLGPNREQHFGYAETPTLMQTLHALSLSYLDKGRHYRTEDVEYVDTGRMDMFAGEKRARVHEATRDPANFVDEWILADMLNKVVGRKSHQGTSLIVHHYDTPIISITKPLFEQAYDALNEIRVERDVLLELTKDRRKSTERKIQIPPQNWHP